ncbi:MAG TPA: ankyrin repeat domain-containing protein [Ferruginibacter sp.]|nr:ankyrin repeat domain-containing protein [Ferruginibacter sp.]
MKKQMHHSLRTVIVLTFSVALFTMAGCNEKKEHTESTTTVKTKVNPPEVDIHTAVMTGNMEALKQHIAAGSNLNEKDPLGGSSPLISASLFGKTEMASALMEAGADLNFQNNDGSTALHTASFFCRPEIVTMLLNKGADKTIKNKYNQTAYESVAGSFAEVKPSYDALGKMLEPMGLKLDYAFLEKTRPRIANMLK